MDQKEKKNPEISLICDKERVRVTKHNYVIKIVHQIPPTYQKRERDITNKLIEMREDPEYSPYVLKYFQLILPEEGNQLYQIIMESCEGNLYQFCRSDYYKNLKNSERFGLAYKLFQQIIKGLRYLHVNVCPQFMHRDLTPDNILYVWKDGTLTFKIADLGISRFDNQNGSTFGIGKKYYRAPETENQNNQGYTNLCDVYAIGALLYYFIVQKFDHNFDTFQTNQIVPELFDNSIEEPEQLFWWLIFNCLQMDPATRWGWEILYKLADSRDIKKRLEKTKRQQEQEKQKWIEQQLREQRQIQDRQANINAQQQKDHNDTESLLNRMAAQMAAFQEQTQSNFREQQQKINQLITFQSQIFQQQNNQQQIARQNLISSQNSSIFKSVQSNQSQIIPQQHNQIQPYNLRADFRPNQNQQSTNLQTQSVLLIRTQSTQATMIQDQNLSNTLSALITEYDSMERQFKSIKEQINKKLLKSNISNEKRVNYQKLKVAIYMMAQEYLQVLFKAFSLQDQNNKTISSHTAMFKEKLEHINLRRANLISEYRLDPFDLQDKKVQLIETILDQEREFLSYDKIFHGYLERIRQP